jgi:hypothetical protein
LLGSWGWCAVAWFACVGMGDRRRGCAVVGVGLRLVGGQPKRVRSMVFQVLNSRSRLGW